MIMPTRVVLEGRDRSAEVILRNSGKETCVYRIYFQEMQMTPVGKIETTSKVEGITSAADLVRFTPRQIEILPGKTQSVRLQLRKPEGLADGEYRSHLVFQGLPPVEPPKPLTPGDDKMSFDIKTIVAISIPVIVRHGETTGSINLSEMSFHPSIKLEDIPSIDLTMTRKGNRSIQGEFKVDWVPSSGKVKNILAVAGTAIYSNLDSRTVHLDFPEAKGMLIKTGKLRVTFSYKDIKQSPVVTFLDVP